MDSLTHVVLGAALGTAVLGRKAGVKAALWGAACATLPDLDVLVHHGDPVRDFTLHRAATHSLFWLSLAAPLLAALPAWMHRVADRPTRSEYLGWWWLVWLTLLTHPLLDVFTVYGTQLFLPFSDRPVGLGSLFIIDPLFTVPLIAGLLAAWRLHRRDPARGARWNAVGIAVATAYLGWSLVAQTYVTGEVRRALANSDLRASPLLVTAAPFTTLVWRVVVMDETSYHEGYRSLFDRDDRHIALASHPIEPQLLGAVEGEWAADRLRWFSKGFITASEGSARDAGTTASVGSLSQVLGLVQSAHAAEEVSPRPAATPIVLTDLRMGHTPWFAYAFVVAERSGSVIAAVEPRQVPMSPPPLAAGLTWLWHRVWDEDSPLPEF